MDMETLQSVFPHLSLNVIRSTYDKVGGNGEFSVVLFRHWCTYKILVSFFTQMYREGYKIANIIIFVSFEGS